MQIKRRVEEAYAALDEHLEALYNSNNRGILLQLLKRVQTLQDEGGGVHGACGVDFEACAGDGEGCELRGVFGEVSVVREGGRPSCVLRVQ